MKRVLLAILVSSMVLLGSGAPVVAQLTPEPSSPLPTSGPRVVDLGDGTVVLVRDPADVASVRASSGRVGTTLPAYVPTAEVEALPGDVYSTHPADFQPFPQQRLLTAGPIALFDGQVIGWDDRVKVKNTQRYPASAAAMIYISDRAGDGLCSGGIVGAPNLLITAAHCVFGVEQGRWFDDWTVFPGMKNKNSMPFGSCGWRHIYVHRKWISTGRSEYDTAAVVLDCSVGNRTGWYGAAQSSGNGFIAGTHHIYQYPGDKPLGTQWYDAGPWTTVGYFRTGPDGSPRVAPSLRLNNAAAYTIDTAGGSSGSSVIYGSGDSYRLGAVHVIGSPQSNYGVLLWKQTWKKVILKGYKKATR